MSFRIFDKKETFYENKSFCQKTDGSVFITWIVGTILQHFTNDISKLKKLICSPFLIFCLIFKIVALFSSLEYTNWEFFEFLKNLEQFRRYLQKSGEHCNTVDCLKTQ